MRAPIPLGLNLAIGIVLSITLPVAQGEVVYSGEQNLILGPGEVARDIVWAGAALTFRYGVTTNVTAGTELKGTLTVDTTRDTGALLWEGHHLAPLGFGWFLEWSSPPSFGWDGTYMLAVADWTGKPDTGEWSGWRGAFAVGTNVFLGARKLDSVGWLQMEFGQAFNNGAPEVRLVSGAYQTDRSRGIIVGSTKEPFGVRLMLAAAGTNQAQLEWWGGSGLYTLQQRTNLATGAWEDVFGPTSANSVSLMLTNPTTFFRVKGGKDAR